jgi:hypothetical protein
MGDPANLPRHRGRIKSYCGSGSRVADSLDEAKAAFRAAPRCSLSGVLRGGGGGQTRAMTLTRRAGADVPVSGLQGTHGPDDTI